MSTATETKPKKLTRPQIVAHLEGLMKEADKTMKPIMVKVHHVLKQRRANDFVVKRLTELATTEKTGNMYYTTAASQFKAGELVQLPTKPYDSNWPDKPMQPVRMGQDDQLVDGQQREQD